MLACAGVACCRSLAAKTEIPNLKREVAMAEDNRAILERAVNEMLNGRNLALVETLFAQGYVYHGPGGLEVRGPEGFKQLLNVYLNAFPDVKFTIEDTVAGGDKIAWRWTMRGTHKGDLMGIAPTGKTVTITGIVVSRYSGGKVIEDWESFDEVGMLRQLGVAAIPAAAHA